MSQLVVGIATTIKNKVISSHISAGRVVDLKSIVHMPGFG